MKIRYLKILLAFCCLYLYPDLCISQTNLRFERISLEQGLSQSTITAIQQDKHGFMWFGTFDGLNKYDGYNLYIYRNNPFDSCSISDNAITALCLDKTGNLWIGISKKGISCYNYISQKFTNYNTDNSNLNNNNINCLYTDKYGNIWIGTANGICLIEYQNNNQEISTNTKSPLFSSNYHLSTTIGKQIKIITEDSLGNIWIGTNAGLIKYNAQNKKTQILKSEKNNSKNTIPSDSINTLFFEAPSTLWIGTNKGLTKMEINKENQTGKEFYNYTTYTYSPKYTNSISGNNITAIDRMNNRYLWVATDNGLNCLDKSTGIFIRNQHNPTIPSSLSVNNITYLYQDNSQTLWVGTSLGGLNKWNANSKKFYTFRNNPFDFSSISSNLVRCFFEDSLGNIWIGTVDAGINYWERNTNTFTRYKNTTNSPHSFQNKHVRAILEDHQGNIWIGTDGGGLSKVKKADRKTMRTINYLHNDNNRNSISNNNIWCIIEDKHYNIWIGTNGGGLCKLTKEEAQKNNPQKTKFQTFKYNNENAISVSEVTSIKEDKNGNIWVSTYNNGIHLLNLSTGKFTLFPHNDKKNPDRTYSIIEDSKGFLWIGARGSLRKFDPLKKQYLKSYGIECGFPNQVFMGVQEDKEGNIWVSTNNGISRFTPLKDNNFLIRNYTVNDGLQSNEYTIGASLRTKNGEILFGGVNGFNIFLPSEIEENTHIPEIVLTRFQIFNQEAELDTCISEKKVLYLKHNQNTFTFEFVAIDYLQSEKNQYAYIMEGFDIQWNNIKNRRFVSYTNLPHGTYTFRIKGANCDGKWNEKGKTITIIISPPFWKTWWFIGITLALIALLIHFIVKVRVTYRQRTKLESLVKERTREILEKNEELKQQQEEITSQRDELEIQRDIANEQKKAIMDSIHYAKRIQTAVLPPKEQLDKLLKNYFVLYKPRDIVSGDYYWISHKDNFIIIVAADCTGHGVPGAFLSLLGISFLNEIIKELTEINAANIINHLRAMIIKAMHQGEKAFETHDGMDVAVCVIDQQTQTIHFSGAYNPIYLIREKTKSLEINTQHTEKAIRSYEDTINDKKILYELKPDKMPVSYSGKEAISFTNHIFNYHTNDILYLFSDGYADQFGGQEARKFMYKQLKQCLLKHSETNIEEQRHLLEQTLEEWRGKEAQVDDIMLIGIQL